MNTTLDEWAVLQTVVQLGSFASAAKKLHRSQSTISYAIARLQEQLGVTLFEIKGRKAQLTETGRAMLADAEPLLAGFSLLEHRARSLVRGGQSEIRLSVDSMYPNDRLFDALVAFAKRFPFVTPRLRQTTFLSSSAEFLSHGAHLCITGLISQEYFVKPVLEVRMLAVSRHDHPLQRSKRPISRVNLIQHMAVIIEGIQGDEAKRQPRSPAQRYLPVNSIEAAIDAVRSGLCFGWLPIHRIQSLLDGGELKPLHLPAGGQRESRFHLACRDLDSCSREVLALAELLGLNRDVEVI